MLLRLVRDGPGFHRRSASYADHGSGNGSWQRWYQRVRFSYCLGRFWSIGIFDRVYLIRLWILFWLLSWYCGNSRHHELGICILFISCIYGYRFTFGVVSLGCRWSYCSGPEEFAQLLRGWDITLFAVVSTCSLVKCFERILQRI